MNKNSSFVSVKNAVNFEKATNKGCAALVSDFISDITASNAAAVKAALRKALKKDGFTPSNTFSMKSFNTAVSLAAATIAADDAAAVMDYLKIKPAHGEKMTAATISAAIEKHGDIAAVVTAAKKAAQPAAKKAARKESAKRGAETRLTKKSGGIIPNAVVKANQNADSAKADLPLQQAATPAAQLDRAINCFCALSEQGKMDFVKSMWKELIPIVKEINAKKTNAKEKVA